MIRDLEPGEGCRKKSQIRFSLLVIVQEKLNFPFISFSQIHLSDVEFHMMRTKLFYQPRAGEDQREKKTEKCWSLLVTSAGRLCRNFPWALIISTIRKSGASTWSLSTSEDITYQHLSGLAVRRFAYLKHLSQKLKQLIFFIAHELKHDY